MKLGRLTILAGYLTAVATILISIVTGVFLWNEQFDYTLPLNDDKLANYATVLGAIGTSIAMIFLAIQLHEMENARQTSYKPLLIPEDTHWKTKNSSVFHNKNLLEPVFYLESSPLNVMEAPEINLFNLGKGIAKNVTAEFYYNIDSVRQKVADHYEFPGSDNLDYRFVGFIEESKSKSIKLPSKFMLAFGLQIDSHQTIYFSHKENLRLTMLLSYENLQDPEPILSQYEITVRRIMDSIQIDSNSEPVTKKSAW